MNQSELKANTRSRRQARENACEHVTIGFAFTFDWSKVAPIAKRSDARLRQFQIIFGAQLKTVL